MSIFSVVVTETAAVTRSTLFSNVSVIFGKSLIRIKEPTGIKRLVIDSDDKAGSSVFREMPPDAIWDNSTIIVMGNIKERSNTITNCFGVLMAEEDSSVLLFTTNPLSFRVRY
ncbi:hypothetical protein LBMAG32_00010 [Nitrosomonadaceae bacterium]|nr:hypothetical protein LBMAG32_00010 [Nitrosomonadaceae bacterium]